MVSTHKLRTWWPDWVVRAFPILCDPTPSGTWHMPADIGTGPTYPVRVHAEALPAFEALGVVMRNYGVVLGSIAGGTYNCRYIAGTHVSSLHAHGVAVDILPDTWKTNQAFSDAVKAIRTNNNKQAFTWGGDWHRPDWMHFQIDCKPSDIATGIDPSTLPTGDDPMSLVKGAATKTQVESMQAGLYAAGYYPSSSDETEIDGVWGPNTALAVFNRNADTFGGLAWWTGLDSADSRKLGHELPAGALVSDRHTHTFVDQVPVDVIEDPDHQDRFGARFVVEDGAVKVQLTGGLDVSSDEITRETSPPVAPDPPLIGPIE